MYHSFQTILFFLAALATFAVADADVRYADIIYYSDPGSCNDNGDWIYCSNVPDGYCCQSQSPFCARLSCKHCSGKTLAAFKDTRSCGGLDQADSSCTPDSGVTCCLDSGSKPTCAGSYYDANTKSRSDVDGFSATPSNSTCLTPDGIVYHDSAGVRREITNMTTETYQKVMNLYGKGEMDVLNGTVMHTRV